MGEEEMLEGLFQERVTTLANQTLNFVGSLTDQSI